MNGINLIINDYFFYICTLLKFGNSLVWTGNLTNINRLIYRK